MPQEQADVRQQHAEIEMLRVAVHIPGNDPRTTTALFTRMRRQLLKRDGARGYVFGVTAEGSGHSLKTHHHPVERRLMNMIDWQCFAANAQAGMWGKHAAVFDWDHFDPEHPEAIVDDMTVNCMLLCKQYHTGHDEGIHTLSFPLFIAQQGGAAGYQFSQVEIIHHFE